MNIITITLYRIRLIGGDNDVTALRYLWLVTMVCKRSDKYNHAPTRTATILSDHCNSINTQYIIIVQLYYVKRIIFALEVILHIMFLPVLSPLDLEITTRPPQQCLVLSLTQTLKTLDQVKNDNIIVLRSHIYNENCPQIEQIKPTIS